jgi:hypothetical protein
MTVVKANLVKKSGKDIVVCYPASTSDVIKHDGTLTVKDVLDAIVDSVDQIEERMPNIGVYMTDENNKVITDESGTGVVALL